MINFPNKCPNFNWTHYTIFKHLFNIMYSKPSPSPIIMEFCEISFTSLRSSQPQHSDNEASEQDLGQLSLLVWSLECPPANWGPRPSNHGQQIRSLQVTDYVMLLQPSTLDITASLSAVWGAKIVPSSCTQLGPTQVMEVIIIDIDIYFDFSHAHL